MPVGKIRGSSKQEFLYQPKAKNSTGNVGRSVEMAMWRSGTKLKIKVQKNYKEKFQKRNDNLKLALYD